MGRGTWSGGAVSKGKGPLVGKLGQRIRPRQSYVAVCACFVMWPHDAVWYPVEAHAGWLQFGNSSEISALIVGSELHKTYSCVLCVQSCVSSNSISKQTASSDDSLGRVLFKRACWVGSALALSPLSPLRTNLPVIKLPHFNYMASITPPPLCFHCGHEKQTSLIISQVFLF